MCLITVFTLFTGNIEAHDIFGITSLSINDLIFIIQNRSLSFKVT